MAGGQLAMALLGDGSSIFDGSLSSGLKADYSVDPAFTPRPPLNAGVIFQILQDNVFSGSDRQGAPAPTVDPKAIAAWQEALHVVIPTPESAYERQQTPIPSPTPTTTPIPTATPSFTPRPTNTPLPTETRKPTPTSIPSNTATSTLPPLSTPTIAATYPTFTPSPTYAVVTVIGTGVPATEQPVNPTAAPTKKPTDAPPAPTEQPKPTEPPPEPTKPPDPYPKPTKPPKPTEEPHPTSYPGG